MCQIYKLNRELTKSFPVASFHSIILATLTSQKLAQLYQAEYRLVPHHHPLYTHDFVGPFKLAYSDDNTTMAEFLSIRDAKLAKSILIYYTNSPAKVTCNGFELV